ncbi:citryl-CoA lyase [Thalassospira lucentensis]|uniref:citryl-CoA lyase n=1 Tax=Thalassospira lucentensis TaxID=168935 RepID=UPI0003B63EA2|nr:citryl-CoA lyase [Thalassospira lucentensis]RCK26397.1 citrate synthase [Thalassospira lucentensis MCCC 1A00383 = DSM 14000]
MSEKTAGDVEHEVSDWWQSSIIDMKPGEIRYSGYAIEDLIGNVSFPAMIWLMTRGDLPNPKQAKLLEAALVAAVDHGPQAPSIAIARMAATCGVGLNNAMASAVNVLGDVHGGAGEQAVALYRDIARRIDDGVSVAQAVSDGLDHQISEHGKHIPGFGHRFHPTDPRAPRLLGLVEDAAKDGIVEGHFGMIAREIEKKLEVRKGKKIPMNIDGATAVIYAELGFDAPLARGLFCLSRSVGILAHAWEQTQQGGRNKGPIPRRMIWNYTGHEQRPVPMEKQEG